MALAACTGGRLAPGPYAGRAGSAVSNYLSPKPDTCAPFPHRQMVQSGCAPGHTVHPGTLVPAPRSTQPPTATTGTDAPERGAPGRGGSQRRGCGPSTKAAGPWGTQCAPSLLQTAPLSQGQGSSKATAKTLTPPLKGERRRYEKLRLREIR